MSTFDTLSVFAVSTFDANRPASERIVAVARGMKDLRITVPRMTALGTEADIANVQYDVLL
jgi:hypothetical protein